MGSARLVRNLLLGCFLLWASAAMLGACSSDDSRDDDDGSTGGQAGSGGTTFSTGSGASGGSGPVCGDGTCQPEDGETCPTCADDCAAYAPGTDKTDQDAEEQAFLGIINDYRMQNGLAPLAGCASLHRAAQGHSEDMRDQDYFDHAAPDGSRAWDRACGACFQQGCGPTTAMAENIAAGNADAQATFTQWMNSPGHDANMRSPDFAFIGIGRALGGSYGSYWTNVFAGDDEPSCYEEP